MFANVMKNRKTTRSCRKDVILGSKETSQEDVYGFESLGESQEVYSRKGKKLKIGVLKSKLEQDSDPYGFNSLKESEEFKNVVEDTQNVKKRRIGSGFRGFGGSENSGKLDKGFVRKSNRKNLDGDSDPYGFNSLQESEDFKNVLEDTKKAKKGGVVNGKENGVSVKKEKGKKEKKAKIGDSDDSGRSSLNSSQQSGELGGFGQGYGGGSENLDKDSDPYGFNSLLESEEFKSVVEGTQKATEERIRDGKENGKKEKNEVSSLDTKTPTVTLIGAEESGEMMDDMDEVNLENSDKGCVSKSSTLNLDEDPDPYGLNSLKESEELKDVFEEANNRRILNGKENEVLLKEEKGKIPTVTSMESQESGEMMDDVDEVNFMSLDGLRKGQPVRIRRESLLSLLMSCGTSQQRQLLRDHGLAKTIMNSILELSLDDSPSNLAAATLFYILTNDGQDDRLLSSSNCIRFVIKLLKPVTHDSGNIDPPTIGSKLLSLHMDASCSQESVNGLDSTAHAIMTKVHDILVSCKELTLEDDYGTERPELDPKWIALLTMGKACVSRVSIEDISGITFKAGSSRFKGKLRELGGLDAIFEVARSCHNKIKGWSDQSNIKVAIGGLVLLLKCLKIMENVTFLSKDNQRHLLEMKGNFDNRPSPRSFVKLVLSVIKILSAMSLQCSSDEAVDSDSQNERLTSETTTTSDSNSRLLKSRLDCSSLVPCNKLVNGSKKKFHSMNREEAESSKINDTDVSEDPFAFDEVDPVPSSWDFVSGRKKAPSSQRSSANGMVAYRKASSLVAECLLTAVKALMNLTNENPLGCEQIAANGGLESLSSLITYHFSSFSMPRESSGSLKASSQVNLENDRHLSDQELDFLVAVLGLLVNLVEKDGQNRSRLASARVASSGLKSENDESCGDVIPLLCSIFLANQGAAEMAEEGKCFSLNDDDAFSQGEKEAEKMIIEAYAALLLAFLSTESKSIRDAIAKCLPDRSLSILVPVLERFAEFHFALNMISPETHTAVLEVIESCRVP